MKTTRPKLNNDKISQSGVTLLLSILIMSTLVLVAIGIATFTIQELRASRSTLLSEPAIGAAESGGEEGLWAIKRNSAVQPQNCPPSSSVVPVNPTNPPTFGNGSAANSCIGHDSATVSVKANTAYVFYLYDPNGINTDTDLHGYQYAWLSVQETGGISPLNITVTRLNNSTSGINPVSSFVFSGSAPQIINISPVPSSTEGRLKVTLTSLSDAIAVLNTDRGMPNLPTISSLGCSSQTGSVTDCNAVGPDSFSRKINITVPQ